MMYILSRHAVKDRNIVTLCLFVADDYMFIFVLCDCKGRYLAVYIFLCLRLSTSSSPRPVPSVVPSQGSGISFERFPQLLLGSVNIAVRSWRRKWNTRRRPGLGLYRTVSITGRTHCTLYAMPRVRCRGRRSSRDPQRPRRHFRPKTIKPPVVIFSMLSAIHTMPYKSTVGITFLLTLKDTHWPPPLPGSRELSDDAPRLWQVADWTGWVFSQ